MCTMISFFLHKYHDFFQIYPTQIDLSNLMSSTDKERLNEALESSDHSMTSWTRHLVEENTSLKEEIEALLMKYRELKAECSVLSKQLELTKSRTNVNVRDGTEVYEELTDVSQTLQEYTGVDNIMDARDDDMMVVDETASDDGDSDVVISSRCNDAKKKEEKEMAITEDAAQSSCSPPFIARHDGSGRNSCTSKQSVIEQERNGAEEVQRNASFVRTLVEENEGLKRRMGQLCIENEELVTECRIMSNGITYKANEVLVLEDRIKDLEEHFELLQGQFGVPEDQDTLLVAHPSQTNCNIIPTLLDGSSLRRSLRLKKKDILTKSIAEEEVIARDDGVDDEKEEEDREGTESVACGEGIDVIIEEENEDEEGFSLLDEDTLTDITSDNTLTEDEFLMDFVALASDSTIQRTATPRKSISEESDSFSKKEVNCYGDRIASEDVITIGEDGIGKNSFVVEENDATKDDNAKEDCNIQQEREKRSVESKDQETAVKEKTDVPLNDSSVWKILSVEQETTRDAEDQEDAAAVENGTRGNNEGTHGKKNDLRDNAPSRGREIKEEEQNLTQSSCSLTKFIEQVWSIIGGSRQIEDVCINGSNVDRDNCNDQVAKVTHVIWELKEENCELYLKQYELKEVVEFLDTEVKLTKEEVNDLKTSKEVLEKERDALAKMCRELKDKCQGVQDENLNISTTCKLLQDEHQLAECLVKDLEQKCFQKEEMFLKMEDEYRNLQQEKSSLECKAEETVELEKKVNFWSQICGKLYSFLKKDNVEMAKVEERCEKISKLAKKERSRRKKIERKNKKLLRKDKIRSEILCRRAKLSSRMGKKMLDLQIEIERLQSEIMCLKDDRNGFEDSYKSAIAFSTQLRNEVARLESKIALFEQTLDRRTGELSKALIDKKLTSEELVRVRKVKREHKKKVDELIEERRTIAMEVKRKKGEIIEAKEKIKEKETLLNMCKVELEKIIDKLKVEAENRHLLELSIEEEKMIRASVEQRLTETAQKLNEAEGRLEEAMKANEELENVIEAQQQEPVKNEKKRGIFGRWFKRRKRKSR